MGLWPLDPTRPFGRVFRGRLAHLGPALAFFLALNLAFVIFTPAIQGGFLFDDEPNLRDLGAYGGVVDWGTFKAFVSGGFAGPTGRPLAMLSFLLDDNTWPSDPSSFKRTNLAFHLLAYSLLFWATLQLLRFYGFGERQSQWLAVLSATTWLLHPFLVSSTFYIVQRMAVLSALFVFAGLGGYLYGRRLWPDSPRRALLWMGGSLVLGTALATLSKENGALLPLFAAVVEFCRPTTTPALPRVFRVLFLWLPSLAILVALASYWDPSPRPWPVRPFNQMERLLTEARIVWDYLGNWFVPRIEGSGLFRDDIVISRSLLDPPQTLAAVLGIVGLLIFAIVLRRRLPLVSLAILFFLAGHLVESTLIGLELYFEHRNYLPAALLPLPLMAALLGLRERGLNWAGPVGAVLILALLAFLSHQRSLLWGNPIKLEMYWALAAPESPRAQNALARHWLALGETEKAQKVLEQALARHPDNGLVIMSWLLMRVRLGVATDADFAQTGQRLAHVPFDAQVVTALRYLVEKVTPPSMPKTYRQGTWTLIGQLITNAQYNQFPLFLRLIPYLQAHLKLADHDPEEAKHLYASAMQRYADIDAAMQMVAEMGNAGYPRPALFLLDQAAAMLQRQPDHSLRFDRAIYKREINRIRALLLTDLRTRHEK